MPACTPPSSAWPASDLRLPRNPCRARRKAEYVKNLKLHCDRRSKGFNTPVEVIEYIFRNRHRQDDLLALTPGVLLERLDPWRRAFELSVGTDDTGKTTLNGNTTHDLPGFAFYEWFQREGHNGDGENTPFFV